MDATVQTAPRRRGVLAGVASALIAEPTVVGALPVTLSAVSLRGSALTWRPVGSKVSGSLTASSVRFGLLSVLS
ncbi:MAG: hypothetical protein ABI206_07400 [Antricoccus sp.]